MVVEHLEAYETGLLVWSFLFGVLGLQGLLSIYLEGETKEVGTHPVLPAPWYTVVLMAFLLAANLGLAWRFVRLLFQGGATTAELGTNAALMFLLLAGMLALYRRHCIADKVVAQSRHDEIPW